MRLLPIRAAASEEAGEELVKQAEEVFNDLKAKVSFGLQNIVVILFTGSSEPGGF